MLLTKTHDSILFIILSAAPISQIGVIYPKTTRLWNSYPINLKRYNDCEPLCLSKLHRHTIHFCKFFPCEAFRVEIGSFLMKLLVCSKGRLIVSYKSQYCTLCVNSQSQDKVTLESDQGQWRLNAPLSSCCLAKFPAASQLKMPPYANRAEELYLLTMSRSGSGRGRGVSNVKSSSLTASIGVILCNYKQIKEPLQRLTMRWKVRASFIMNFPFGFHSDRGVNAAHTIKGFE